MGDAGTTDVGYTDVSADVDIAYTVQSEYLEKTNREQALFIDFRISDALSFPFSSAVYGADEAAFYFSPPDSAPAPAPAPALAPAPASAPAPPPPSKKVGSDVSEVTSAWNTQFQEVCASKDFIFHRAHFLI